MAVQLALQFINFDNAVNNPLVFKSLVGLVELPQIFLLKLDVICNISAQAPSRKVRVRALNLLDTAEPAIFLRFTFGKS